MYVCILSHLIENQQNCEVLNGVTVQYLDTIP